MRWLDKMSEGIKRGVRSWLNVQEANPTNITIWERMDYEANAIKNRIWYRGDSDELQQLYEQAENGIDRYKFWACKSTPGMEMRKIHTGLPSLMVDILAGVTLSDLDISIDGDQATKELWDKIAEDNNLRKRLEKAVKEVLYIGDGAFKISFDTALSKYPILEFYPGDRTELVTNRGRIREMIFKTEYTHEKKKYVLNERYGYGYILYELYHNDNRVPTDSIPQTKHLEDVAFGSDNPEEKYMLAVPMRFYESGKWTERGQSIFDKKIDSFDAFDEVWSQWMDAMRAGRVKEYIPDCLIPRDPKTGKHIRPNHFDNRFIKIESDMGEGVQNKIDVEQPDIPHESYLAAYVTALDLCLQGVISPSTLGIDMKKLDNADAQREKEKATLYTRDTLITALQVDIPALVETAIKAYNEYYKKPVKPVKVTVKFGSYANPSFESQVETVGKGKTQGVMSIEACVEELYGDDKDDAWKAEEVARLKAEQGIAEVGEPAVAMEAGSFQVNREVQNAGKGNESAVQNEPKGVSGTAAGGQ